MKPAQTSVIPDRAGNVILRVYTAWRQDGNEYYEITMSAKDARELAIELLKTSELVKYYHKIQD